MQPVLRNDFRLRFLTSLGGIKTLNIPRANTSLSGNEVREAMIDMIESGVIFSNSGTPTEKYAAEIVETERTDFNIAATT